MDVKLQGDQAPEDGGDGGALRHPLPRCSAGDVDSSCSTPYASAPSSPGRGGSSGGGGGAPSGYFHSAPASPMHFVLSSSAYTCAGAAEDPFNAAGADGFAAGSFEFEFSARFSGTGAGSSSVGSMISADELFLNGQIRPMNLSSHLQRPQMLSPLLDLEAEEDEEEEPAVRGRDLTMRSGSMRRRARSMSPLRTQWRDEEEEGGRRSTARSGADKDQGPDLDADSDVNAAAVSATPASASSSRSSSTSSSRNSKRWVFLKDFLYRSKSEGRGNTKDKFWNALSFSPSKEKSSSSSLRDRFKESLKPSPSNAASPSSSAAVDAAVPPAAESQKAKQKMAPAPPSASASKKPASSASSKPMNAVGKRRGSSQSAHERHYTANRAQAEEMRKKTFLPYRQGLLGCLWFSSRSYGAMNGLARALNPVTSR